MNHATVNIAFFVSLLVIMPIGLILMILWGIKIIKPMTANVEKSRRINLSEIAFKALIYMFPGMLVFLLFSIPVLYFGYLRKQETFCRQMIEVNKLTTTHPDLEKKCGMLDINELLENSRTGK